ncbi:MFS transporter [soil metagenome]
MKTYRWIPTIYIMQGLPFGLVVLASPILYKTFGINNIAIAFYTSLFILPWMLKFFLAPALEDIATKKIFVCATQALLAIFTLMLAASLFNSNWFYLSLFLFAGMALVAAVHDITSDGMYLDHLDTSAQAKYVGIRSVFYQMGKFISQGLLIIFVGFLSVSIGAKPAWSLSLTILALIMILLAWFNQKTLPICQIEPIKFNLKNILQSYQNVLNVIRKIPFLISTTIFIFFYNFSESQLVKIFPLFLLDNTAVGGLGLPIEKVGSIFGGALLFGMLTGVFLAGFILRRFTLKICLVPFSILAAASNIFYLLLSKHIFTSFISMLLGVFIAQLCFGLSNGAYMLYIINFSAKSKQYAMSLYAIGTGIMLGGMLVAGSISGYLQHYLGYNNFFIWIIIAGVGTVFLSIYTVRYHNA